MTAEHGHVGGETVDHMDIPKESIPEEGTEKYKWLRSVGERKACQCDWICARRVKPSLERWEGRGDMTI